MTGKITKAKGRIRAHVKAHGHKYGIIAAVFSVKMIPMLCDLVVLLVADSISRLWIGGRA